MLRVVAKENYGSLTKGKIYEVIEELNEFYAIIDNEGDEVGFYKWRFLPLDCKVCEMRKCNSCPISKEEKC